MLIESRTVDCGVGDEDKGGCENSFGMISSYFVMVISWHTPDISFILVIL